QREALRDRRGREGREVDDRERGDRGEAQDGPRGRGIRGEHRENRIDEEHLPDEGEADTRLGERRTEAPGDRRAGSAHQVRLLVCSSPPRPRRCRTRIAAVTPSMRVQTTTLRTGSHNGSETPSAIPPPVS